MPRTDHLADDAAGVPPAAPRSDDAPDVSEAWRIEQFGRSLTSLSEHTVAAYQSDVRGFALWAARAGNPYPVARPGTSAHERGRAVDVPRSFADRLAAVGPAAGLCRPLPRTDPVHFEPCRPSAEGP